ncbi:uncharacterized protein LOC113510856 [Galleria mellonella]|uniref:snRNA-activating protein complex subunit 3 n=1 Tax=Galleria mellonella TaxID=7137 RepID=A0ABM3M9C3_GALME|nr:uncharacterized protein LOC113510856 [Galleria mellonella]
MAEKSNYESTNLRLITENSEQNFEESTGSSSVSQPFTIVNNLPNAIQSEVEIFASEFSNRDLVSKISQYETTSVPLTRNFDENQPSMSNIAGISQSDNVSHLDIPEHEPVQCNTRSNAEINTNMDIDLHKVKKNNFYGEDLGPKIYHINDSMVSRTLIPKNLPAAFSYLPIYGRSKSKAELPEFQNNKIREFVGCDLGDEEFKDIADYCRPDRLKTGKELMMITNHPGHGLSASEIKARKNEPSNEDEPNLCVLKKQKRRLDSDFKYLYLKKMKYRGIKMMPLMQEDDEMNMTVTLGEPLQPGKDLLYRIRIYRPFAFSPKEKMCGRRQLLLSCDVVLLGRQKLAALRDRMVCPNDIDMRVDVSERPDNLPPSSAKELFPSGFLFINNVFYVDTREGCRDISLPVRQWASRRGIGLFPRRDLNVRLDELPIRLGHPEVYVHQGNCEHLFTFSEIRLLNASDPLKLSQYPCHTEISQNQTVYCTTCAEFGAKWVVVGCDRVPFDPAFFCDKCFKMYLYKDGKKIGQFKAYSYKGNELNVLKPQS